MTARGTVQTNFAVPVLQATDITYVYPDPVDWGTVQLFAGGGGGGPAVPTEGQIWPRAYPT